eukprot:TRINITY_DN92402_c0_g1_i1.p1 TRINITY_DN92402_c0_g1~~TRINITY_DN92402_c0_g1_i1.p1  ORF type:complete len:378 (+),score=32.71 TRINITY_DN92402_c0_g1_i1:143-1135(+)
MILQKAYPRRLFGPRRCCVAGLVLSCSLLALCSLWHIPEHLWTGSHAFVQSRGASARRSVLPLHAGPSIAAGHAQPGTRVRFDVRYKCTDAPGVFSALDFTEPLEFVVGAGEVVAGLEEGVRGMTIGETRLLSFDASNALFGQRNESRLVQIPADRLPDGAKIGDQLVLDNEGTAIIADLAGSSATLDFNHPLAGRALTMAATLLSCNQAVFADDVQVETLVPGDRVTYPSIGDRVTLHYSGSLQGNGRVFASTREPDERPITITAGLQQSWPGLDEALMQMSKGERAIVHIPAVKAYGEDGHGELIPPNANLDVEVEILDIYSDFYLAD